MKLYCRKFDYNQYSSDMLHSELRILNWILYQVCSSETNNLR